MTVRSDIAYAIHETRSMASAMDAIEALGYPVVLGDGILVVNGHYRVSWDALFRRWVVKP